MKIVVIGGSGRIGEKLVFNLRQEDLMVLEASPSCGVNTITGEGLDWALECADVVVDVSNAPSTDAVAALRFFEASGLRLLAAGRAAGVRHHIALSIVGTDRLQGSGYFRAKRIQEELIEASGLPFSLLRATPFFEAIAAEAQRGDDDTVRISPALVQPVSGLDIAEALADLAIGEPLNRTVEVAGPDRFRLTDLAAEVLTAYEDPRRVVADFCAPYLGAELDDASLLAGPDARIGALRFEDWLRRTLQARPVKSSHFQTIG